MGNTKNIAFWIILFLLMVALFNVFSNGGRTNMGREISYSDFLNRVEGGQVASVRLDGERVYVTGDDGATLPDRPAAQHRRAAGPARDRGRDPGGAAGAVGVPLGARAVAAVPAC